jgi:menaquinone-9 beta-reductase
MAEVRCDVLIVGGGPAGLATAIALRQRGADVLVADALTPPIDKACGEGIMPDSRRDLADLGVALPASLGAEFRGIRFCDQRFSVVADFPSGHGVGAGLGVRRTLLQSVLVDHAAEAGVRFAWKTSVAARPGHPITLNGEPVRYKFLAGADGQSSRIRAWAGLEEGSLLSRRFGFRIHYRIAPWSRHVEVHWASHGQAYVTPVADDEVCVSVMTRFSATQFPHGTRSEQQIASIPGLREHLMGAKIINRERGAITTTRRFDRVTSGNVALVGDASGSADAITGEGLAMAFRQAHLLADAMGADNLSSYQDRHPGVMRLPQTMARIMLLMDRWPLLRDRALRVLAHDPILFRAMLHVHIGEKPLRQFLLRQAPSLGLRLLMPSLA